MSLNLVENKLDNITKERAKIMKVDTLNLKQYVKKMNQTRKGNIIILKPGEYFTPKKNVKVRLSTAFECLAKVVRPARFRGGFDKPVKGMAISVIEGREYVYNFCPKTQVEQFQLN